MQSTSKSSHSSPINIPEQQQQQQQQQQIRRRIVTISSSPLNRLSTTLRRHSQYQDDNKQRRLSTWAVFGAVMDQESFSRSMSDERQTQQSTPATPTTFFNTPISDEPASDQTSPINTLTPQDIPSSIHNDTTPQLPHTQTTTNTNTNTTITAKLKNLYQLILNQLPTSFKNNFRVIIKCSIAYLIASMFSFYDPLSDLLVLPFGLEGPFSGAHVIATIVTYYLPAATVGKMMEANHYAIWGLFWLAVIIVGSTLTSVLIENRTISHSIILVVFVAFGYGSMTWVKLKSPGFSTTCSMIIVISSVILTREGSIHFGYLDFKKSLIYTEVILVGMLISNLTCIGFWRGSGTDKLEKDINKTLESFSTLIGMLTKTFLLDETIYTNEIFLKKSIDGHHASFTCLKESLNAAIYEFFEPRIQRSQLNYQELIASMNRLAQHLTGLRSGCTLQYELLEPFHSKPRTTSSSDLPNTSSTSFDPKQQQEAADLQRINDVFVAFCEATGPSLKNLMATGVACLHAIKTPSGSTTTTTTTSKQTNSNNIDSMDPEAAIFISGNNGTLTDGIDKIIQMRNHLSNMIHIFQQTHSIAMSNLYRSFIIDKAPNPNPIPSDDDDDDDNSSKSSQLKEEIFVICFFLFNMEEFMKELCHLLDIFVDIRSEEEVILYETTTRITVKNKFSRYLNPRNWFKKGNFNFNNNISNNGDDDDGSRKFRNRRRQQRPRFTAVLPINPKTQQQRPFPMQPNSTSKKTRTKKELLLNKEGGEQNSSEILLETKWGRIKRKIYDFSLFLNDPDTKTSIKVGIGAALMMLPAFIDVTRPTFHHYRAQWAVVTYMIVMASTLGQTNFLVIMRMIGTLIGSGVALIAQFFLWENGLKLALFGFFFSVPCFWLILTQKNLASTGRFLLLSYNLVCLYSFNVRDHNVHILNIAYNRILCVFVGVLFGWMINSLVWPYKARRELRKCLSEFLLETAFLFSFLVKHYSTRPTEMNTSNTTTGESAATANLTEIVNESSPLLSHNNDTTETGLKTQLKSRVDELSKMELFLQVKLIRLFGLLSATRHEPRLKGPFPTERYRKMLNASQSMLDMLHSLRGLTVREEWFNSISIKQDFLISAKDEHRELIGNLLLFLSLLSTSIELKSPLPPYLPPATLSRNRLLEKIYLKLSQSPNFIINQKNNNNNNINGINNQVVINNYSLLFAYSVAIKHILFQLEIIGNEAQNLFGIIGGIQSLDEFDRIFSEEEEEEEV